MPLGLQKVADAAQLLEFCKLELSWSPLIELEMERD